MQCPCCLATSFGDNPPHGDGIVCPLQVQLKQAEIAEYAARKDLLVAQRDATLANTAKSSR